MRKSRVLVDHIYNNTNRIIENVLQATISNNGTNDVKVFGTTLKQGDPPFRIDSSNTTFDLELKEIEFEGNAKATENNVVVAYQILQIEQC